MTRRRDFLMLTGAAALWPLSAYAQQRKVVKIGFLTVKPQVEPHWGLVRSALRDLGYAEGMNVLHAANVGKQKYGIDAETTPLRDPELYQYDFNLPDVAELWRRGSVIASWLLDLTATALHENPSLSNFAGRVSDSGEGRWTIKAAIDEAVPVPVLSSALFERFASRGEAEFADKLLSAMRYQFGGHVEKHEKI